MAQFQEVMKQWQRRCEACEKNESVECGINGTVCEAFCKMQKHIDPEFVERDVMLWAAEHPEPVYPTFADWLYDSFLKWCQGNYPGRAKDEKAWFDYIYETRIPADIAEKLGIEPKNG